MSKRTHRVFELSLLSCLAGITFACFAFFPAVAGVGAWTSNGPELGHVRDVAIDPSAPQNVYAATVGGLFKSVDGGSSWSRVFITTPNQISLTVFYAVAVSPSGRVYVGTQYYDSLWWSDDGGQNWFPGSGLPDHNPPWTIVVDPTAPHTTLFGATPGPGVYRSDDGGMNWVQAMGTAPNALPFGVTTDLTFDGSTIYACGANNRGVWKSTDLGANWYPVGAGLPTQSVRAMALDPTGNLYVATHQQGVYRTSDGGNTWQPANGTAPTALPVEAFDPAFNIETLEIDVAGNLYLGGWSRTVYRGRAGGATWSGHTLPVQPSQVYTLAADPTIPGRVLAGTDSAALLSLDAAATWSIRNAGLTAFRGEQLLVDAGAPQTVVAAGQSGVARSLDGGATWADLSAGLSSRAIYALAACPAQPPTLSPAYYTVTFDGSRNVLFRHDGGAGPWNVTPGSFGPGASNPSAVDVDPQDADHVVVGNTAYSWDETAGYFLSANGGVTWTRIYEPDAGSFLWYQPVDIAIDPLNPDRIYGAAVLQRSAFQYGWNVVHSTDGGASMVEVDSEDEFHFPRLLLDPTDPVLSGSASTAYLYLRGSGLFRRSDDGGTTWQTLPGTPGLSPITFDPDAPGTLYGMAGGDLKLSRDRGESWESVPTGDIELWPLPGASLGVAPTAPPTIHVGTVGGVYSYTTLGPQTQQPFDSSNPTQQPVSLDFDNMVASGTTSLTTSPSGPPIPGGFKYGEPPVFYDVTTTVAYAGQVEICIHYDPTGFTSPEAGLLLHHYVDGAWTDITASQDTVNDVICGLTSSLSPFVLLEPDGDADGMADAGDLCPGTVLTESVPTDQLKNNRWALMNGDTIFDTVDTGGPPRSYSTVDTGGCSCEQIIEAQGLGAGHRKFGCSNSAMEGWIEWVQAP